MQQSAEECGRVQQSAVKCGRVQQSAVKCGRVWQSANWQDYWQDYADGSYEQYLQEGLLEAKMNRVSINKNKEEIESLKLKAVEYQKSLENMEAMKVDFASNKWKYTEDHNSIIQEIDQVQKKQRVQEAHFADSEREEGKPVQRRREMVRHQIQNAQRTRTRTRKQRTRLQMKCSG